ncbi:MAG: MFS transporter, partial [Proteobacteria bacterium]|nr:MFS transporter [Pseudomonadota bacterium]
TLVFCLVGTAFTSIYITQPVLPVLQMEFGVDETTASFSISAVILGIALSNLPLGIVADRYPIRPIIIGGSSVVIICALLCAVTDSIVLLIIARFFQGLSIPSLTTCLAAYLSRSVSKERLNVVIGSYVSATVAGGLIGRLLGGWIHSLLHWRYAFVSSAVLLLAATIAAYRFLPPENEDIKTETESIGIIALMAQKDLLRIYVVAFAAFFVFSSIFNYLPFYLSGSSFQASTEIITLMYLSYIIGIIVGPLAGKLSNKAGNGVTITLGALVFGISIGLTLIKSMLAIVAGLIGVCAGFFAIHASAAGSLNRKLTSSQGLANSLYVLFYYLGGFIGITISGYVYIFAGWSGVAALGCAILLITFLVGIGEIIKEKASRK